VLRTSNNSFAPSGPNDLNARVEADLVVSASSSMLRFRNCGNEPTLATIPAG
jgi:hypothetical protein